MTIKRAIFWLHLSAGMIAGIIIFTMSFTGVLLTYEKQIIALAERQYYSNERGLERLTADQIIARARTAKPKAPRLTVIVANHPDAPIIAQSGRESKTLIDPYTGEILGAGAENVEAFFSWVTAFHRWFALEDDARRLGRQITGAANLLFLFLTVSGIYIWLPKIWRSQILRNKLLFQGAYPSSKARDYNWHNVVGIWSVIPLLAVVTSAIVFSYPWAHTLVFKAFGEEPPQRMQRGGPPDQQDHRERQKGSETGRLFSYQDLLQQAQERDSKWNRISIVVASPSASLVDITVDTGTGGEPFKQKILTYSRASGELIKVGGAAHRSKGMQARIFIRFLHTGESFGLLGQTIAGLVSLGTCFLVYTGLALAYRRLVRPQLKRRERKSG